MATINYNIRTSQAKAALKSLDAQMMATSSVIQSSSRLADTALMAVSASFVAMGAGAFVAYNAVNQFQESLTTVRALGGVTESQMYELADAINEVASQFGVSGDEIAQGAVMLSKAGLTVEQVNESIGSMTALSKANGIAFEEAARMTVFAVNTFGKEFSESTDLMDKMQVATQESILDIGDLQKAFAFAGSTAVMSGVSFEQLVSIMAVLSNRALEAGISARSVNKMFLDMITNTDELQEFMNSMGMTFEIIKDGKLDIDALMEAFSGQQLTLEMLQSASDVFTVRALRSFGLLIGAADEYQTMLADVTNSQGALQEVVEMQMTSFTAMFAKLRQELLAPLRSPEVIEQVSVMVDGLIEMFNTLKPQLLNTIILSLKGFSDIITDEGFINAVASLGNGLFVMFQALGFINNVLGGPGGTLIKIALGMKIAAFFTNRFMISQQGAAAAILMTNKAQVKYTDGAKSAINAGQSHIFNTKMLTFSMQRLGQTVSMVASAFTGMVIAGMMFSGTDNPILQGLFLLNAVLMAFNSSMMIATALIEAFKVSAATAGIAGVAMFVATIGAFVLAADAFKADRASQMAGIEDMAVADTGMFVGRKSYDTGGAIGPRHQLVYVEPGEQIISKTQGMAGMGGGITVNVGDVYAQDGTDFAQKLAEELPRALRVSSYSGGF